MHGDRLKELTGELRASVTAALGAQAADRARATSESPVVSALDTMEQRVAMLLREHSGMADELLRAYEQLGIVFDLTRQLLTLRREQDVISLVVDRLFGTYPEAVILVVNQRDGRRACTDIPDLPDWLTQALNDSHESRRVVVGHSDEAVGHAYDGAVQHTQEALIAPVFAGDSYVCSLVLWRRSEEGPVEAWNSGDMQLFDSLGSFCGDAIRNFRLMQQLQEMSMDTVRTLVNAVDQKDPYTSGHSNRVGYYSKLLAAELGFNDEELRTLEWSALMHDVGKIGIRDEVLKKAGRLTPEEFEHIKEHPLRGYHVVRENPHMREALDGVLHHHERYDGKGYPDGLKGEDIPLQARIIQIADIFDALTTTRSYRGAFGWEKALGILEEESGTVVDPRLCGAFVGLMRRLHSHNPSAFSDIGKPDVRLSLEKPPTDLGVEKTRG